MLCGVLAYIQQIKVSVSYIYSVRDKIDQFLAEVDKDLGEISTTTTNEHNTPERASKDKQLARFEARIEELAHCAQEATRATPYLNDNRGNLYRITDSLARIGEENEQYRKFWEAKNNNNTSATDAQAVQADELSGIINALQTEIKSQIQAADWVFTKIDALIQNTSLNISRADQKLNMEIADSSYTISVESKRDNLSMMTIAAITMIFLPGTFVATFFAMPLLDWSAQHDKDVMNSRFWIYWAVMVPLTVTTVLVWWFFMVVRKSQVEGATNRTRSDEPKKLGTGSSVKPAKSVSFQIPLRTATERMRLKHQQRTDWSNA